MADDSIERGKPGVIGGLAELDPAQLPPETLQARQPLGIGEVSLVRKIVGLPREAVNLRDGMAKFEWQEQRRNREIFVVGYAHLLPCTIYLFSMG
jgi:hypothetical protein